MPTTPVLDQDSFRGRNDDGSETTATWKAAANTNWSQDVDTNFRVRFLYQETAGGNPANLSLQLQYNLASAGWNNVTGASSVVRSSLSANFVDLDATTQQLGVGTFDPGVMEELDGLTGTGADIGASEESEVEFCVQIRSADVTNAQTLQLRIVKEGGTVLDTYTNTPTITVVEGGAPANLRRYTLTTLGVG